MARHLKAPVCESKRNGGTSRFLIVSDTLPPDRNGVATIVGPSSDMLSSRVHTTVVGPYGWAPASGSLHYLPMRKTTLGSDDLRLSLPSVSAIARETRKANVVIVHTIGPLGLTGLLLSTILGKPSLLVVHNNHRQQVAMHLRLRQPVAGAVRRGMKLLERSALRMATVSVGYPNQHFKSTRTLTLLPQLKVITERSDVGKAGDEVVIAYHGRVSPEKRVDLIVSSVAEAQTAYPNLRLLVIGDGLEMEGIRSLAGAKGVRLTHVPWCREPLKYLANADIYVTASKTETHSVSTLEAMGLGIPVIARAVGAIPRYISHGNNGILFHEDGELVSCITMLLADPAYRARLGEEAQQKAVSLSVTGQVVEFIMETVGHL